MPTGAMGISVAAKPALLFFIDRQRLERDCIGERLASLLPEWRVEAISRSGDMHRHANWTPSSVLILHTHRLSMSNPEIAGEMAMLARLAPAIPILIMSELCDASEVTLAFGFGARGYLPTSLTIPEVCGIVRFVAQGGTYVPAFILSASSETHLTVPTRVPDETEWSSIFSPRQLQVLDRLKEGKSNKVIAFELGISEATVKVHMRDMMKKLNVGNRTQLALMAKDALEV